MNRNKNNKKRAILLSIITILMVIFVFVNTNLGIGATNDSLPIDYFPDIPIIIILETVIPNIENIINEPIYTESKPDNESLFEEKVVIKYNYITFDNYRVPLSGLFGMNEGDCFN